MYGDKAAFEWTQIENEQPVIHVGEKPERVTDPGLRAAASRSRSSASPPRASTMTEHAHLSFIQGGGHGGSHPHLVHEFVSSIVEGRPSFPDVYQSVNWTCAGICAHESAMQDGRKIALPDFRAEIAARGALKGPTVKSDHDCRWAA